MKEYKEKSDSTDFTKELSALQDDMILDSWKTQFKLDTVEISNSSWTTLTYNPKVSNPNTIKKDASVHIEPPILYDEHGAVIDPELERYDMTFKNVVQMDGKWNFNTSPIGKYKQCRHIKTWDEDRSKLGELCKESWPVLTIMDHNSPDKMFGYSRKEFARMLAVSNSKYIILWTCNGQNLAEEILSICYHNKIMDKVIYSPTYDNKRHGIHPGESVWSMEYVFGDQFVRSSLWKNSAQDPADAPDYIINIYSDRDRSLVNPIDKYSKRSST